MILPLPSFRLNARAVLDTTTPRTIKPVRFQPPPKLFRISPDSEVEILNRKKVPTNRAVH